MIDYILFIPGFVILIKGADFLVNGASSIAKKYNVSNLVIGLTIVSFGTSMPELIVNLVASFNGSSELALGNVFGSNVSNILLILGVASLICPLPITKSTYLNEIPFSLTATILVGFLANAALFSESSDLLSLSRGDGAVLLFFFAIFMGYIFTISKEKDIINEEEFRTDFSPKKAIIFIILGIIGLSFGGEWVVNGGIKVAQYFGFSESFIGLTIIAIGTSLPELFTSAVAAYKKDTDIAVGNVVGSNIFNLLWILGISALIKPLPFDIVSNTDIVMIIIASTLLLFAIIVGKKPVISRWEGVFFLLVYIGYIVFLSFRG